MAVRRVSGKDASDIAKIYNFYIENTTITFETMPISSDEMAKRVESISSSYPYLVYEKEGRILGYCYAHLWKEKAAYQLTAEVTIYVASDSRSHGIGSELMERLLDECNKAGLHSLIACITVPNDASVKFHEKYGFKQVSYFREVGRKFDKWLDIYDYELILG